MRVIALAAVLACSAPTRDRPPATGSAASAPGDAVPPARDGLRWFVGDLHMHVAPPDCCDVALGIDAIAEAAKQAGMDFVILTPHLWPWRWAHDHEKFQRSWRAMADHARTLFGITMIPGIEWTTGEGHFGIAGVDVDEMGKNMLADAHAHGAFITVNHPFAVPTNIPGVGASDYNMSYRVWTEHAAGFTAIDAVEVWNVPLGYANVLSRPGGMTGEQRAWREADRVVHSEQRKLVAVGGSDNHKLAVAPTTYVLAPDASEASILAALRAGRTCVGGTAAGSLRIRGDASTGRIGDSVRAAGSVQLAWDGEPAHVFVDGIDQGERASPFTHDTHGALHTYRIELGSSRCGFVYANLAT